MFSSVLTKLKLLSPIITHSFLIQTKIKTFQSVRITSYCTTNWTKKMNIERERGIADGAEMEEEAAVAQAMAASVSSITGPQGASSVSTQSSTSPSQATSMTSTLSGEYSLRAQLKTWKPNEEYMKMLMSMGITRNAARKALFYTNNASVELAASWIFENPNADLETPLEMEINCDDDGKLANANLKAFSDFEMPKMTSEMFKMVFVVNSSLEMGVGKIAAQVAHSALGMHQLLLQNEARYGEVLIKWFDFGETKIVLKGESTSHLIELEKKALDMGLPTYLVQDAGKTQVKAGSTTVLCLFGQVDVIDQVTGTLRLL